MNPARIASAVSLIATVLVVITFWVSFARERELGLLKHLERAMAAGAFPYALLMIYGGAIDPSMLLSSGTSIPIVAGGLAIAYVSIMGVTQKRKE